MSRWWSHSFKANMSDRAIIRFVNVLGASSAAFEQFSLYRAEHQLGEGQYLVSWHRPANGKVVDYVEKDSEKALAREGFVPQKLRVYAADGSLLKHVRNVRALLQRLREAKRKTVVHLHSPTGGALFQVLKVLGLVSAPTVYTVHNVFPRFTLRNKILTIFNCLMADEVAFCGLASERSHPAWLRGILGKKARSVQNGANFERVMEVSRRMESEPKQSSGRFELVNVARMIEVKQQSSLLKLLAALPQHFHLTIVGGGELDGALRQEAVSLGLSERVTFTGIVPRDVAIEKMGRADLFVSPSTFEGLPIAVLEAMAMARPVLLSNIGPHQELCEFGCDPRQLISGWDLDVWKERVMALAQMSSEELACLGASNRDCIAGTFTLQKMHAGYTRLYDALFQQAE